MTVGTNHLAFRDFGEYILPPSQHVMRDIKLLLAADVIEI